MNDDKAKKDEDVEKTAKDKEEEEKPAEEAEAVAETEAEASPVEEPETQEPKADVPTEDNAASADPTLAGMDQQGRQLYNVKCSNCGKDTQVPFKPSGDRPVYCRDCYMQKKNP